MMTEAMKQELEQKLKELERFCLHNHLPFFACVALNEKEYNTRMVSAEIAQQKLDDDMIAKCMCVMRGFDIVPHNEPIIMELFSDDESIDIE